MPQLRLLLASLCQVATRACLVSLRWVPALCMSSHGLDAAGLFLTRPGTSHPSDTSSWPSLYSSPISQMSCTAVVV